MLNIDWEGEFAESKTVNALSRESIERNLERCIREQMALETFRATLSVAGYSEVLAKGLEELGRHVADDWRLYGRLMANARRFWEQERRAKGVAEFYAAGTKEGGDA